MIRADSPPDYGMGKPSKTFLTSNLGTNSSNPTHKTKTGTANSWETTTSNPIGLIKLSSQSETGSNQYKLDLTQFIRLFQGSESNFFSGSRQSSTGFTDESHSRLFSLFLTHFSWQIHSVPYGHFCH